MSRVPHKRRTSVKGDGFLAIWSDIAPEIETDYLHWLTREHTTERVSIPGFLAVRVFRALHLNINRFFILYELDAPDVVGSAAYLARLNAPTPWSKRMMPNLGNFVRGGGCMLASFGPGQGGFVCPIPLTDPLPPDAVRALAKLADLDRVAAVRAFETDDAQSSIGTNEKSMRASDSSFATLVVIEALDEAALANALEALHGAPMLLSAATREPQLYSSLFGLDLRFIPALAPRADYA
jgi:hypothetical protein